MSFGGLVKKQGGKRPWNCYDYLHCGSEENACSNLSAQLYVQELHKDKGRGSFLERKFLVQLFEDAFESKSSAFIEVCIYLAFMR